MLLYVYPFDYIINMQDKKDLVLNKVFFIWWR